MVLVRCLKKKKESLHYTFQCLMLSSLPSVFSSRTANAQESPNNIHVIFLHLLKLFVQAIGIFLCLHWIDDNKKTGHNQR